MKVFLGFLAGLNYLKLQSNFRSIPPWADICHEMTPNHWPTNTAFLSRHNLFLATRVFNGGRFHCCSIITIYKIYICANTCFRFENFVEATWLKSWELKLSWLIVFVILLTFLFRNATRSKKKWNFHAPWDVMRIGTSSIFTPGMIIPLTHTSTWSESKPHIDVPYDFRGRLQTNLVQSGLFIRRRILHADSGQK